MSSLRTCRGLLRSQPRAYPQICRRTPLLRQSYSTEQPSQPTVPWKTPHSITSWPPERLLPPPKEGELLLERKPNRDLPPIPPLISPQLVRTFPIFVLIMAASMFAFFNYQKQESSVVSSTLYALRTNPDVRAELGNEIYFASKYPWIRGEINQVHGRIDVRFWVKGTKKQGEVRLNCRRRGRGGLYVTKEWSVTLEDGRVLQLYDPEGDAVDPFAHYGSEE
ncbi:DUF1783-domain-containing protein [Sporormia fimetaria CBS 119925]|uniref:DUF1783-domain-containing protein n=1 Tax=Sporormia fimetaria CBS 119925 TaxID=1340428 RepID=A0A6A6UW44_9PLEO|nr:DUF1783-domain-containing protein [Sporormia fimetaria CBS 119925]